MLSIQYPVVRLKNFNSTLFYFYFVQDSCLFKDEMKFMKDFDPTQRLAKKK